MSDYETLIKMFSQNKNVKFMHGQNEESGKFWIESDDNQFVVKRVKACFDFDSNGKFEDFYIL